MLALLLQHMPSDSPAARGLPAAEQSPGPLAPTNGATYRYPLTPPPPQSSVGPIGGGSRLPRRSRSSARVPNPGSPGGHLEDLARGVPDMPAVRLAARFHQGAAAGHPPGHRLRRPVLLRTPGIGWPGDGHGRPLDCPVGRTSPVQGDRPADGYGPGPDSDGQAADTSTALRPTMRLVSRPRPTTLPAHPGPDRTGRQCACSLRLIPAATSTGTHPA